MVASFKLHRDFVASFITDSSHKLGITWFSSFRLMAPLKNNINGQSSQGGLGFRPVEEKARANLYKKLALWIIFFFNEHI